MNNAALPLCQLPAFGRLCATPNGPEHRITMSTPLSTTPAPDSLAARVDRHLLHTVGVAPADLKHP